MNVLAILQARVSSTRLPGKVLAPILNRPMLALQIERLRRAARLDQLMVATSCDPSDDPLAALCTELSVPFYRGSLDNVLERFYQAALPTQPKHIVRLTGDCPLADPTVIDACIDYHLDGDFDYTSNTQQPTFPDGLDVEVFRFDCLAEAREEASLPSQREHVTPFLYQNPKRYRIGHLIQDPDLSALRWTVDEPVDFELVKRVYETLYPINPAFTTNDILHFLATHPEVAQLNLGITRNEGYIKSLLSDKKMEQSA